MICPACKKIISDDDGGVQIKDYLFCTPNCLFARHDLMCVCALSSKKYTACRN